MPVALVMRQYRRFLGEQALSVTHAPHGIDVVASRSGNSVFLNLVNTHRRRSRRVEVVLPETTILSTTGALLAEDPSMEISSLNCREVMQPHDLQPAPGQPLKLPAASVSSLNLTCEQRGEKG